MHSLHRACFFQMSTFYLAHVNCKIQSESKKLKVSQDWKRNQSIIRPDQGSSRP